jgi:hypothetical protein
MPRVSWALLVLVIAALTQSPALSASPPPPPKPPAEPRPAADAKAKQSEIAWHLDRNFASGMTTKSAEGKQTYRAVRAVDVSDLDPKQRKEASVAPKDDDKPGAFAVWSKKFDDDELKFANGYASVVDEKVFTDLRMVRGQDAAKLGAEGIEIGRVKLDKYDPVELAQFLVGSGIVDANIHILASVTGTHFTNDAGHWFDLHSDDPYWTNQANHARYSFGLHIAPDGVIRMINPSQIGRAPEKRDR